MTAVPYASLSHVGISVWDLDRMVAFYGRVLGFMLTDRGPLPNGSAEYAFMSRNPDEHHQIVLATGRKRGVPSQIVQLSLKMGSLADLRRMYEIVRDDAEATNPQTRAHGIAWSLYFRDPEGNTVECFTPSPWYVHAPSAVPFDFETMSDEEIFDRVAAAVEKKPGFSTYAEWKASAAERMRSGGHWPG